MAHRPTYKYHRLNIHRALKGEEEEEEKEEVSYARSGSDGCVGSRTQRGESKAIPAEGFLVSLMAAVRAAVARARSASRSRTINRWQLRHLN